MIEVNGWQIRKGREEIYGAKVIAEATSPTGQRATHDDKGDIVLYINEVERGNPLKGQQPIPLVRFIPFDVALAMKTEAEKPDKGKK